MGNDQIQAKLLGEAKLTYDRAVQIAQSMEAAAKNQKELNAPSSAGQEYSSSSNGAAGVHQVVSKKSSRSFDGKRMQSCYRCGKTGHHAGVCRHKDDICSFCGKKGHLQIVCLQRRKRKKPENTLAGTIVYLSKKKCIRQERSNPWMRVNLILQTVLYIVSSVVQT